MATQINNIRITTRESKAKCQLLIMILIN